MPGVVRRDSSCKISHGVEFAIAVPSSYVSVVSTLVDRTRLVSSLARACGIFRVDEIVIIDDSLNDSELVKKENNDVGGASSSSTSELMHRLLTYLDTPQYLRRRLIPHHADLAYAGKMPTLDAPHQLRKTDRATYREGAVVAHTTRRNGGRRTRRTGSRTHKQGARRQRARDRSHGRCKANVRNRLAGYTSGTTWHVLGISRQTVPWAERVPVQRQQRKKKIRLGHWDVRTWQGVCAGGRYHATACRTETARKGQKNESCSALWRCARSGGAVHARSGKMWPPASVECRKKR
ncbi:methyltransferase [Pycnococcus provasolii]